ncbi:MAG: AAA family ATPase [Fibrobacter sp.]|nr:AAA family ATPase [Fibrobacter sp.]
MERIGQYTIIQELQQLNAKLNLWLAENDEGEIYEVLSIAKNQPYDRMVERLLRNEVKPLINREIPGFQKIVDTGIDDKAQCYFVVYENTDGQSLEEVYESANMHDLKEICKGLNELKMEKRENYIISPRYMVVNAQKKLKTRYAGLYELFKFENLLEKEYLAPNVVEWLSDTTRPRPNFQDDIYALIKSFEVHIHNTYYIGYELNKILQTALAAKRTDRLAKYHILMELLEQLPIETPELLNLNYNEIIKVQTQAEHEAEFQELVNSMNENAWFLVENKRSNGQEQITGRFSTNEWHGRFFVDERGYIFIPFNGCRHEKHDRIISNDRAFLAEFAFTTQDSNFDCVDFFTEKFEAHNSLAELNKSKNHKVKIWQTLPEQEIRFIEENAFSANFNHRENTHGDNIKFYLENASKQDWHKIKNLKNEDLSLYYQDPNSEESKIGKILDYHPKENYLIIKDPLLSINAIESTGKLYENVIPETIPFKRQIEACNNFVTLDVENPALCSILATPETTAMPTQAYLASEEYDNFSDKLYNSNLKNDETQKEAVLEALNHKPVYLIQGPPGAGKTTVIVEIIRQLVERDKDVKILVSSQSNLAVDNVLEKLEELNQKEEAGLDYMRLASSHAMDNKNINASIVPNTYANKLKNWVTSTAERSTKDFSVRFADQEKHKIIVDFYEFYALLNQQNDWEKFQERLKKSQNYLKNLFAETRNFKDVQKILAKTLGSEFLTLKDLQRDWLALLGNTTKAKKNRPKLNNGSEEKEFLEAMLHESTIIGATCIHIASSQYKDLRFDYVIMDESSKAAPAETLVPINMGKNIVMIGDHKQLPPVVTREKDIKKWVKEELEDNGLDMDKTFGESLFEKLILAFEEDESKHNYIKMLDVQYRMPKQVGALISKYFYDGKLKNPETTVIPDYDRQKHHELPLKKDTSIVFYSTSKRKDPYDNNNKFKRQNNCNVQALKDLLTELNRAYSDNLTKAKPFTIGIIAGYRGQVELLKSSINLYHYENFVEVETPPDGTEKRNILIEINTVDKFQGAERDIIIYDVVRSSKSASNIGFLDDYRRINVAISRVKRLLFIVGDSEYLIKRATLNPTSKFTELKLKRITQELQEQGLVFHELKEVFQ